MIYFDVTDIVQYAQNNARVSGIQRVQLKIIGSLAQKLGPQKIACVYWHPSLRQMQSFDPNEAFRENEFDGDRVLTRLDLRKHSNIPQRKEVRRFLMPYNRNKVKRALMKGYVYYLALADNKRLASLGIDTKPHLAFEKKIAVAPRAQFAPDDIYVFLGANWSHNEVMEFGKRHMANGGIVVQMIYDLIPYLAPNHCGPDLTKTFGTFLRNTANYANRFTAISDWTRKEFIEFLDTLGLKREVITVPLAHEFDGFARNQSIAAPTSEPVRQATRDDFVLCVGTIEDRKNGITLLRAWAELVQRRGRDRVPALVFAGKLGWKSEEFLTVLESLPSLKDKVRILSSPSDEDLAYLYCRCRFTIYPSRYEGWGLPVGEAAWFGKYSIVSSATSLPEVCGDMVDYVDPDDAPGIAGKVSFALDSPEYVAGKEARIRSAALRTWSDVADHLMSVIESSSLHAAPQPDP